MSYKKTVAAGLSLAVALLVLSIILGKHVLQKDYGQNTDESAMNGLTAGSAQEAGLASPEESSAALENDADASDNAAEVGPAASAGKTEQQPAGEPEQQPAGEPDQPSADAAQTASSENSVIIEYMDYIDAWQEWHTMVVDPTVPKNIYDAKGFIADNDDPQRITYSDPAFTVLQGIDVYEGNGEIDWQEVADAGYSFAFVRVGYRGYGQAGRLCEDCRAIDNLQAAKAAGLKVGAYFFSQALSEEEAREEAEIAVKVIEESGVQLDLPLVYDPEIIKNDDGRANNITRDQVALNTRAFRETAERTGEYTVDIYSNLPWEDQLFTAEILSDFDIWYADYEKIPQTPYHFTWWQYTNEGTVPGIEGDVDLNLWIIGGEAAASTTGG